MKHPASDTSKRSQRPAIPSGHKRATRRRVPPALAPIEPGLLLTKAEAATLLGFSVNTVSRLCLNGTLPSVKIGLYRRLPRHALDEWVEQQTRAEAEQARVRRASSV